MGDAARHARISLLLALPDSVQPLKLPVSNPPLVMSWAAPLRLPVPMAAPPSWKVTVPVGAPLELVIVEVKVTLWPRDDGLAVLVTVAVALACDRLVEGCRTCWRRNWRCQS